MLLSGAVSRAAAAAAVPAVGFRRVPLVKVASLGPLGIADEYGVPDPRRINVWRCDARHNRRGRGLTNRLCGRQPTRPRASPTGPVTRKNFPFLGVTDGPAG